MFGLGDTAILPIRGHMADMNAALVLPASIALHIAFRKRPSRLGSSLSLEAAKKSDIFERKSYLAAL